MYIFVKDLISVAFLLLKDLLKKKYFKCFVIWTIMFDLKAFLDLTFQSPHQK